MQNLKVWPRLKADAKRSKSRSQSASKSHSKSSGDSRRDARPPQSSPWPTRFWIGFFLVWALLISGLVENTFHAPGIFQVVELKKLESERREKMVLLETEIAAMQSETENLQKSVALQEREIRKTLGYVAEDEILFDFSAVARPKVSPGAEPVHPH